MSYSVSYTKKGSGRVASRAGRKAGSKLNKAKHKRIVGLKNAIHSLVQAHFDEKSRERFLANHS